MGTAHNLKSSVDQIKNLNKHIAFSSVAVEACAERFQIRSLDHKKKIIHVNHNGVTYIKTLGLGFKSFSKMQEEMNNNYKSGLVRLGGDMEMAVDVALQNGRKIYLIDRKLSVTKTRLLSALEKSVSDTNVNKFSQFSQLMKRLGSVLTSDENANWLSNFKKVLYSPTSVEEKIQQLAKTLGIKTTEDMKSFYELLQMGDSAEKIQQLVNDPKKAASISGNVEAIDTVIRKERDVIIANNLQLIPDQLTLAVVGVGHIQGICTNWARVRAPDIKLNPIKNVHTIPIGELMNKRTILPKIKSELRKESSLYNEPPKDFNPQFSHMFEDILRFINHPSQETFKSNIQRS